MSRALALCLALAAPPAGAVSGEGPDAHEAPVPYATEGPRSAADRRRETLAELWQRRLLPPETDTWAPEDLALLERLRHAEAVDAIAFLRRRVGGLKDLAVAYRPAGAAYTSLRLTKAGHERYLFLKSQEALRYFESKGVDAKWAFQLADLDGRRLFEPQGLLTPDGEAVYEKVLANRPVHWRTPAGEVYGNRRPPPRPQAAPAPAPINAPPARPARPPMGPGGTVEPPTPKPVAVSTAAR